LFQEDQQHNGFDQHEGDENSSDDDDDLSSINSEDADELYEDNFEVGVEVDLNESFDEELPELDPRIGLVIES
jgi:hypothetical protein